MKRALLAVLVVLGLASTATFGHAAALNVGAGSMTTVSSSNRCSTATTAATAGPVSGSTATSVVLTFPADCHGKAGRLRLVGASGALSTTDATFTLPATGTTHTVTVPSYTPTAVVDVAMVLGGWGVPVQWSYTPPPPPTTSCTVVNSNGNPVGNRTCSVTAIRADYWGTAGNRRANVYVSFSPSGMNSQQGIAFVIDLSAAVGLPAGWSWGTSGSMAGGNITTAAGYACSEMPLLRGTTAIGWGSYSNVYIPITENRATTTGLNCS